MPDKKAPIKPDASKATDDELDARETELRESADELFDSEDPSDNDLEKLQAIADELKAIKAEKASRETKKEERKSKLDELKSEIAEPEAEAEGEEDKSEDSSEEDKSEEPEKSEDDEKKEEEPASVPESEEKEPEKVAASVEKPKPGSLRKRVSQKAQQVSQEPLGFVSKVSAKSVKEGDSLTAAQIAETITERINGGFRGPSQNEQRLYVARMDWSHLYPEDRIANRELEHDQALIASLPKNQGVDVLTASGGLCAPVTPYYQLADISQAARPVRDSLVQFNANRGGITFVPPSLITDFTGALTDHTVADDEAGSTKACLDALCNAAETVNTRAIVMCLTFGNMRARTFPEQVTEHTAKTTSAHARFAERLIIDAIDAASTAVTAGELLGAVRDFFATMDRVADQYRNRHRMAPGSPLQVIVPLWLKSMFQADLIRQLPGDNTYAAADAFIASMFSARNLAVTYAQEGATGSGQDFGAQAAGGVLPWPDTVIAYVFHPGMFLFLDGGTLDLGVVRDSTLNSTNDYQIFSETFEGVAAVGIESLKVTLDICPSGKSSAAEDVDPCTTGS